LQCAAFPAALVWQWSRAPAAAQRHSWRWRGATAASSAALAVTADSDMAASRTTVAAAVVRDVAHRHRRCVVVAAGQEPKNAGAAEVEPPNAAGHGTTNVGAEGRLSRARGRDTYDPDETSVRDGPQSTVGICTGGCPVGGTTFGDVNNCDSETGRSCDGDWR